MECLNPARGDRRKVTDGMRYPFAVTSSGNTIYYTDWQRFGFLSYHKPTLVLKVLFGLWSDVFLTADVTSSLAQHQNFKHPSAGSAMPALKDIIQALFTVQ